MKKIEVIAITAITTLLLVLLGFVCGAYTIVKYVYNDGRTEETITSSAPERDLAYEKLIDAQSNHSEMYKLTNGDQRLYGNPNWVLDRAKDDGIF